MSSPKLDFHPSVYWYLTERCNLQCKHCWVSASPTTGTGNELTLPQMTKVLDQLVSLGVTAIAFSGGEPLLHKSINELVRETRRRQIPFSIETNSLLINDEFLRALKDPEFDFMHFRINISLDGGDSRSHDYIRGEGTFHKTLNRIARLKEERVPFMLQCVVNKMNLETIPDLIKYATDMGAENLTFAILQPVGRALDCLSDVSMTRADLDIMIDKILEGSKQHPSLMLNLKVLPSMIAPGYLFKLKQNPKIQIVTTCKFPMIGITAEGSITFCSLTKKDLIFGNVLSDNIAEVVKKVDYQKVHDEYLQCEKLEGICASCVFKSSCKGSCRSLAYTEFKSIYASHPFCQRMVESGDFPAIYMKAK